jgi:Lrp/AsnC family transcriptional regulator, regulator for asnA, asnC and gidA
LKLEDSDIKILIELQKYAKISYRELSENTGIPSSTLHDRVKKMTDEGVIKEYITSISDEAIGCTQIAIIGIETGAELYGEVATNLTKLPEITEIYGTTAQYDLMIKLRAYNRNHLGATLNKIRNIRGVNDINVAIALEVFKEEHSIPIMPEFIL